MENANAHTHGESRQRSLEQQRAKHAWEKVSQFKRQQPEKQKEMRSLASSAPASIQSNGLGQTLAFWRAKNEVHHRELYNALSDWLKTQIKQIGNGDALDWIIKNASSQEYRYATAEAMAYLNWYKRFAEAELEESKS